MARAAAAAAVHCGPTHFWDNKQMRWLVCLVGLPLLCATDPGQELNLGVNAFREGHYHEAVTHFNAALRLDPGFITARLYLGTAYLSLYVPGVPAPENQRFADLALEQFQQVLQLDPENDAAIGSIALMYFNQKKYPEARQWYYSLTEADPENKEAFYSLGVIAWSEFRAANPGPNADPRVRAELRKRWRPVIAEGIRNLHSALDLDSNYEAAMGQISLLLRHQADLDESGEESARDLRAADEWAARAAALHKRRAR
jgi:tetratricopeptide (TPR) repeat protein